MSNEKDSRGVVYTGGRGPNRYQVSNEDFAAMEQLVEDWCEENGYVPDEPGDNVRLAFDPDQPDNLDLGVFIQVGSTHYGHRAYGIWELLDPVRLSDDDDRKYLRMGERRSYIRPGQNRLFYGNGDHLIEYWKKHQAGWFSKD